MKKLFAAAVLLLALFGCSGHAKDMEAANEKGAGTNYEYESNTVRCEMAPLAFEVTYLSQDKADLYFSIFKGGKYKNPFPPSLILFLLTIENKGRKAASFNPGLAWVYPEKGKPSSARDYTSLYADLDITDTEDLDERMEAFRASSFDGTETIPPGGSVKKILVFSRGREPFEKAGLVLNNIYAGKDVKDVKFIFPGGLGRDLDKYPTKEPGKDQGRE